MSPITHRDFSKSITMRSEMIRLWNSIKVVENHHALRGYVVVSLKGKFLLFLNEVTKHVFIHLTVTKVHLWPPKGYYLCQGTIKNFQWRHYFTWILTLSHREQWRWLAWCAARLDSVWTAGCLVGPVAVVWGDGTAAARGTRTKEGFQKTGVNHMMSSPKNPGNKVPNFLMTWLTLIKL